MARKFNRFGASSHNRSTVTCRVCGKLTRETGEGEGSLELCKPCLYDTYAENAGYDYGFGSEEHQSAVQTALQVRKERGLPVELPEASLGRGRAAQEYDRQQMADFAASERVED